MFIVTSVLLASNNPAMLQAVSLLLAEDSALNLVGTCRVQESVTMVAQKKPQVVVFLSIVAFSSHLSLFHELRETWQQKVIVTTPLDLRYYEPMTARVGVHRLLHENNLFPQLRSTILDVAQSR